MVRTLKNLSELRETGFGRPHPRHGLNLLWWFAHDCVQIDWNGRMTAKCNPENGDFGFHRFFNSGRFLPYSKHYYEVGNLNNAGSLPDYVTEYHTGYSDSSNKDRIIVTFDSSCNRFEDVYVTQHSDQTHFDQNHTYRISLDLLKTIKTLNSRREMINNQIHYEFNYRPQSNIYTHSTSLQSLQGQRSHQSTSDCSFEMICMLILALFVFCAGFLLFKK